MSDTLDQLVSEFLQYGDRPFIGPDACDRLRNVIVQLTGGAVNPPFDRMGENHTYWMAAALQWLRDNSSSGAAIQTTPEALDNLSGISLFSDIGLQNLTVNSASSLTGYDIESQAQLTDAEFPNLFSVDPTGIAGGYIQFSNSAALMTLNFPKLTSVGGVGGLSGVLVVDSCSALTVLGLNDLHIVGGLFMVRTTSLSQLSIPNLTSIGGGTIISNNALLQVVSIPQWMPDFAQSIDMSNNALDASSVNSVLAQCAANAAFGTGPAITVDLSGGTSAAPSGQGIADAATLTGRGVTVITN